MQIICGLKHKPVFCPTVADFYNGMEVTIPLFTESIRASMKDIEDIYSELYKGPVVKFIKDGDENGFRAFLQEHIPEWTPWRFPLYGNEERIILTARYDNLGKRRVGRGNRMYEPLLSGRTRTKDYCSAESKKTVLIFNLHKNLKNGM